MTLRSSFLDLDDALFIIMYSCSSSAQGEPHTVHSPSYDLLVLFQCPMWAAHGPFSALCPLSPSFLVRPSHPSMSITYGLCTWPGGATSHRRSPSFPPHPQLVLLVRSGKKKLIEDDSRVPHVILYNNIFGGSILGSAAGENNEIWVVWKLVATWTEK
jgi:hypothetical protein